MNLIIQQLDKQLGGRPILAGLTLTVDQPGVVAVFGENGAGKSTLLSVLAGLLVPDRGQATLDGASLFESKTRHLIGFVPEAADPPGHLLPDEFLALVAALKSAPIPPPRVLELLDWPSLRGRRIGALSLGQRRRTCLAAALCGAPPLLLLDEPTNGLDAAAVTALVQLIDEQTHQGGLTLLATHDEPFAERVHARRLRLKDGHLTAWLSSNSRRSCSDEHV